MKTHDVDGQRVRYFEDDDKVSLKAMVRFYFKYIFNPSHSDPGRRVKNNVNFIFTLLCGASKGLMKALKGLQTNDKICVM